MGTEDIFCTKASSLSVHEHVQSSDAFRDILFEVRELSCHLLLSNVSTMMVLLFLQWQMNSAFGMQIEDKCLFLYRPLYRILVVWELWLVQLQEKELWL